MIFLNLSERLWKSSLFQHGISGMSREDFIVDREGAIGDRTMPNLVVTPTLPHKIAFGIGVGQDPF
ncbi:MAG: hypothetical protein WAU33_09940 [Candidatus Binataceae bacterium]